MSPTNRRTNRPPRSSVRGFSLAVRFAVDSGLSRARSAVSTVRPLVYDGRRATFQGNAPPATTFMTVTSRGLYAYLTILTGNRAGTNFPLDARRKTLIGRGTDCHISLPDPLCSRIHATLTCTPDGWVIRDNESRNGTLVNGQKIDEATVVDGNTIRVGSNEFEFHESEEPPADANHRAGLADCGGRVARGFARWVTQHGASKRADAALSTLHQALGM
jgi:FHA domain-containing protein